MKEIFEKNISNFVALTTDELERFFNSLSTEKIKKGNHLLSEGEQCRNVYFIVEGCMKYYYLIDGEEKIGQFFFEGAWISDLFSFLTRQPSVMNISAIEHSELLSLSYEQMQLLYIEIPKLERFGRLLIEQTFIASQRRSASFLTKSPTEKYQHLINTRPKVINRVPQYMIASYLGIKPESLSRIRKKLAEKDAHFRS